MTVLSFPPAFLTAEQPQRDLSVEAIHVHKKLALVIGNQSYLNSPLKNPVNDADMMARALLALGFDEVVEKTDLTFLHLRTEIDRFSAKLQPGDLALFYYAGHGVQAKEQNYLIPIDFVPKSEADLPYEAYSAAQVRDKLEESGARLRIMILDACRNNPFHSKRDGARGLSPMGSSVEGTYIAYATADNSVADDNPAESNGLFTKKLLTALRTPGLDLKQVFEKTKQDVYLASHGAQRPFTYDGIIGQFYFTGPVTIVNTSPTPGSSDLARQEEVAFWNGIDKSDTESLRLYLGQYPNGRFAAIAQRNLTRMESATVPVTAGPMWPMDGGDVRRSGYAPYHGPRKPQIAWSVQVGNNNQNSPLVGPDGRIYLANAYGRTLSCIENGSVIWTVPLSPSEQAGFGMDHSLQLRDSAGRTRLLNRDGSVAREFASGVRRLGEFQWGSHPLSFNVVDGTPLIRRLDDSSWRVQLDGEASLNFHAKT